MSSFVTRCASFDDVALLSNIMVQSFRSAFAGFVSKETLDTCTNERNCQKMLEDLYREGKMHFRIGERSAMLVWQETEDGVELVAIHSLPESWGSGLGHIMLTDALQEIGNRPVFLWAFEKNTRARRFYEKHGFHWDGNQRVSEFDGAIEVRYVKDL